MIRVALLCLLLAGATAKGLPIALPKPRPMVTKVAGAPVTAQWVSGNRAELRVNRNPVVIFPMSFQVTENLCTSSVGQRFEMHFAEQVLRLAWVWTVHSDPSKVGTIVLLDASVLKGFPLVIPLVRNNFAFTELGPALPKDQIEFSESSDVSWIPGMGDGVLRPLTIGAWNAERMLPNPQTGLNENRIVRTMNGVHLKPTAPHSAAVEKIDSVSMMFPSSFQMGGDVVSWILQVGSQRCQISLKPDVGTTLAALLKYEDSLPNNFASYNWQEDRLSQIAEGFLLELVNNAEE